MLWLVFAGMTALAVAALLVPYLRSRGTALPRSAYDLEIYRDQLAELERDRARGLIGEAEAKAARTEIARRALATDAAGAKQKPAGAGPSRRWAVVVAALAAPTLAFALYLGVGSPRMPSQEFVAHGNDNGPEAEEMVARLENRLKEQPDDLQGWLLLARSYSTLGRSDDAIKAWREALKRSPEPDSLASAFGEALVEASGGTVTPEAEKQFETAQHYDPLDPRPRYYIGLSEAQAGDARAALQNWVDLMTISPADAPWLPMVREQMGRLSAQAKIDPASIPPSADAQKLAQRLQATAPRGPAGAPSGAPRGAPSGADVAAIEKMSPEDRNAMIRTMVDSLAARLESNPGDIDGWLRLGRAREVLGEPDKSVEAYAKAAALAPDRLDAQTAYANALFKTLPKDGDKLPQNFVAVMRHILELDPNYGDALWFVGLAEAEAGNRLAAIALWQRLLNRLPDGSKEREQVQAQIEKLKQATN